MRRLILVVVLVLSIFLIACNNNLRVTLVMEDFSITYTINKGESIELDEFENINGFEGAYYDKEYELKYDYSPLESNLTLYIKKIDLVTVKLVINGCYHIVELGKGEKVSLADITLENKAMFNGLYYDQQYTVEYQDEIIDEDITLYIKTKDCFDFLDKLTDEEVNQIMNAEIEGDWPQSTIKNVFGRFKNGIIVAMYPIVTLNSVELKFDDVVIYNHVNHLLFYSSGKLYFLEKAYEQGLISYDEIKIFKEIYEAKYLGWMWQ